MGYPRGIKANTTAEVNAGKRPASFYSVIALTALFALSGPARTETDLSSTGSETPEAQKEKSPEPAPTAPAARLPEIEARNFAVKVIKRSTSGKTYLFDDLNDSKAQLGKLLLLRREPDPTTVPAMAFRVVKLYPEQNRFAAKRVRRYGTTRSLESGVSYTALEKLGELLISPPTAQDKADLSELEAGMPAPTAPLTAPADADAPTSDNKNESGGESAPNPADDRTPHASPFDADLDSGSTPPPADTLEAGNSRNDTGDDEEEEGGEPRFGASVDEVAVIDHHRHWFSAGVGYFRTVTGTAPNLVDRYYKAGGIRYGFNLGSMIFLKRNHLQDSITLEAGAHLAKLLLFPGGQSTEGSYTVMPLLGTARYNLHFGETFGLYFYGGILQTIVLQFTSGVADTITSLQTPAPAAGAGLFFQVGPAWYIRTDLGMDSFTLGLTLRF